MPYFQTWIDRLSLQPHPEGGYWGPAFRADEQIRPAGLPERYRGVRELWSSIYFMVTEEGFSAFHRLQTDELWHFYTGDPLRLHLIHPDGRYESLVLGPDWEQEQVFQMLVRRETWFAAEVAEGGCFSLCGCTLSPGFAYADFALGQRDQLIQTFPAYARLITLLTRSTPAP